MLVAFYLKLLSPKYDKTRHFAIHMKVRHVLLDAQQNVTFWPRAIEVPTEHRGVSHVPLVGQQNVAVEPSSLGALKKKRRLAKSPIFYSLRSLLCLTF